MIPDIGRCRDGRRVPKALGRLGTALVLATGCVVGVGPAAQAQSVSVSVTRSLGSLGGSGMISKRSVEKYAEMLGLSPEQKDAAMTMHSGYAAAYAENQKAMRDAIDEVRRSAEDSGDSSVFMEKMPKIEKERKEAGAKLEKDFFGDLKALLSSPGQEEKWGKVERARRREVGLRQGQLSGENVDLIEVVGALKLDGEPAKAVALVLESYEMDLDRQLAAREAEKDDGAVFEPGKPIDIEKIQQQMAKGREAGVKIRDVNQNAARRIEAQLPDDKREIFKAAMRRASFPRVFRDSRVSKELGAALKMSDLDGAQKEQIDRLQESYDRELGPVNNAWANAIEASESSGKSGAISGGGASMVFSMEDEADDLKAARKARRELDEKTAQKLRSILRPDQNNKLPKQFEGDEPEPGGPGMMIMRRGE